MIEITYITTLVFILPLSILIHLVFSFGKRKHYPSGPFGLPIFGHLPFIGHSPPETFLQWSQKYGNVFSIRMGSWKTVVVNGYEAIKEAASKADDAFSGRPEFVTQKMLENVHGEVSLGFGPFDDIYLHHRKLVANSLRYFTNKKSEYTENLIIDEAEKLVVNVLNKSGQPVDIRSHIQYATGSVIYQILYGKGGDLKEQLDKMVRSLDELIKFTGNGNPFDVMPWLQYIMPWKISSFRKSIEDALLIRRRRVSDHVKSVSSDYIRDLTDLLLTMDMQEKKVGNNGLTR
jgi:cytochrome P450